MITKTVLAAAAFATAIAAQPVSVANAGNVGFSFGIQTDQGYMSFGNGGYGYHDGWDDGWHGKYSCHEARQTLRDDYKKVQKIECNGNIYTFKVKKHNIGPWKIVKFNRNNGNYWYA